MIFFTVRKKLFRRELFLVCEHKAIATSKLRNLAPETRFGQREFTRKMRNGLQPSNMPCRLRIFLDEIYYEHIVTCKGEIALHWFRGVRFRKKKKKKKKKTQKKTRGWVKHRRCKESRKRRRTRAAPLGMSRSPRGERGHEGSGGVKNETKQNETENGKN